MKVILWVLCLTTACSLTSRTEAQTLDAGLDSFVRQIAKDMTEGAKRRLAVVEFSDLDGHVTTLGELVSEELITRLFLTKKFDVVERSLLNKVIEENKLQVEGLVDPETAKELGRILGVDTICSGTVAVVGTTIRLNGRLIDTTTGSIFGVASSQIANTEALQNLYAEREDTRQVANDKSVPASPPPQASWKEYGFTFINSSELDIALEVYGPGVGRTYQGKGVPVVPSGRALFVGLPGQGKYGVRVLRPGIDAPSRQWWTKWTFLVPNRGKRPQFRLSMAGKVSRAD